MHVLNAVAKQINAALQEGASGPSPLSATVKQLGPLPSSGVTRSVSGDEGRVQRLRQELQASHIDIPRLRALAFQGVPGNSRGLRATVWKVGSWTCCKHKSVVPSTLGAVQPSCILPPPGLPMQVLLGYLSPVPEEWSQLLARRRTEYHLFCDVSALAGHPPLS
jgi:hypothetical protein